MGSVTMSNNGYVARVECDEEKELFHGEIINSREVLTFQGRTWDEAKAAFAETIVDYVEWCRERGKVPVVQSDRARGSQSEIAGT